MPRITNDCGEMEIVITPETTHVLLQHIHDNRRIFTDGRDWPKDMEPTFAGYSIGKWIDTAGNSRYDLLEVETRGFKSPRAYDTSGIPLHKDNATIVKERIYLDKADRDVLHDEVTVLDHALTRPWVVLKGYHREPDPRPYWREVQLLREQQSCGDPGRRNPTCSAPTAAADAHQEGPAAAGFEIFQAAAEISGARRAGTTLG